MKNTTMKLLPIAMILMGASALSHAATNAELTVTGTVAAGTCDLTASKTSVDLGSFVPADFTEVGKPVADSQKDISLLLSNCKGTTVGKDTLGAITVRGTALSRNANLYNEDPTKSVGVILTAAKFKDGVLSVSPLKDGDTETYSFEGYTSDITLGLASAVAKPSIGYVKAPLVLSFAYN